MCWAFNEQWNNKFYYKVASCWLFILRLYSFLASPKYGNLNSLFLLNTCLEEWRVLFLPDIQRWPSRSSAVLWQVTDIFSTWQKRAEIIIIRCKICFVMPCRRITKCRLIIGSIYFDLIQFLVSHFSYKIEIWKHGVKSCKGSIERQTADRCICLLTISTCLRYSSVINNRRLNLLTDFKQLRAEKAEPRFLLCVLHP
jgi:hypothetical protein